MPHKSGVLNYFRQSKIQDLQSLPGFSPCISTRALHWTNWGTYSAPRPPAVFGITTCHRSRGSKILGAEPSPPPPQLLKVVYTAVISEFLSIAAGIGSILMHMMSVSRLLACWLLICFAMSIIKRLISLQELWEKLLKSKCYHQSHGAHRLINHNTWYYIDNMHLTLLRTQATNLVNDYIIKSNLSTSPR